MYFIFSLSEPKHLVSLYDRQASVVRRRRPHSLNIFSETTGPSQFVYSTIKYV